jgi:hypothetical protein
MFPSFGTLCQEKCGNPDWVSKMATKRKREKNESWPAKYFLPDPERELVDEASGRGHDEDGVVEEHDVKVKPLDLAKRAQQIEVGDAWSRFYESVSAAIYRFILERGLTKISKECSRDLKFY